MNLTLSAELDSKKMNKFRRQFGESSNQALVRLGVDTAKMAAVLTQPEGKGKKKIIKSINSGANKNIAALPAKTCNYFANKRSPAFPFQGSWVRLDDSQILRGPGEIYDFVEKHRDNKGRVKSLSRGRRAICKQGDMDKAMTARRKLAGRGKIPRKKKQRTRAGKRGQKLHGLGAKARKAWRLKVHQENFGEV